MKDSKPKIELSREVKQIVQRRLALYCTYSNGLQYIHLLEIIQLFMNIPEARELIWNQEGALDYLSDRKRAVSELVAFEMVKKELKKNNKSFPGGVFKQYVRAMGNLPVADQPLTNLLLFFLDNSNLKGEAIPNAYMSDATAIVQGWTQRDQDKDDKKWGKKAVKDAIEREEKYED